MDDLIYDKQFNTLVINVVTKKQNIKTIYQLILNPGIKEIQYRGLSNLSTQLLTQHDWPLTGVSWLLTLAGTRTYSHCVATLTVGPLSMSCEVIFKISRCWRQSDTDPTQAPSQNYKPVSQCCMQTVCFCLGPIT